MECHKPEASAPRSTGWDLFKKLFGADPYTAVDLGGWKLLAMNSMLGYTWDVGDPGCNTRWGGWGVAGDLAAVITAVRPEQPSGAPGTWAAPGATPGGPEVAGVKEAGAALDTRTARIIRAGQPSTH